MPRSSLVMPASARHGWSPSSRDGSTRPPARSSSGGSPAVRRSGRARPSGPSRRSCGSMLGSSTRTTTRRRRKLQRVLRDERDAEWLAERLRPLIDLPARPATHDENFAAWLRFLESMCRARPTIIVIEDLHWASELLVAFLAHVAAHLRDVPLLCLGTARPEIFTPAPRLPDGARRRRASRARRATGPPPTVPG